jgi:hypothetical protein
MSEDDEGGDRPRGAAQKRGSRRKTAAPAAGINAGGLFVSPVQINPDQLIHYIKEQAAEQASQAARERLNFFFTIMGLFLAVVGAIGVGTLLSLGDRVKADLESTITTGIADKTADLNTAIDSKIDAARKELEESVKTLVAAETATMQTRTNDAMLLPLLVSEANSIRTLEGSYDRKQILDSLGEVRSRLNDLPEDIQVLVLSRVADIIEAMSRAADDRGVLAVRDLFGDDLPLEKSVYYNIALSLARLMIYDRNFAITETGEVDAFLAVPYDDYDRKLNWANGYVGVVRAAVIEKAPSDRISTMMSEMATLDSTAVSGMLSSICSIYSGSAKDGFRPNAWAHDNAAQLIAAAARADSSATGPDTDPDRICWGYGGYGPGGLPPVSDGPIPTGVLTAPQPEGPGTGLPATP